MLRFGAIVVAATFFTAADHADLQMFLDYRKECSQKEINYYQQACFDRIEFCQDVASLAIATMVSYQHKVPKEHVAMMLDHLFEDKKVFKKVIDDAYDFASHEETILQDREAEVLFTQKDVSLFTRDFDMPYTLRCLKGDFE